MKQGKKGQKKEWKNYLSLGLLVLILVFVIKATWNLYWKNQMALENLRSSSLQMEKLIDREVLLKDKIERLKTPRGVEEEIRSNFPVVKEGEKVINIVEEKEEDLAPASTAAKRWWQIF